MKGLEGPVAGRAAEADRLLERALVAQARKVARLSERRRHLRKRLRDVELQLRTQRKFLGGMVSDRNGR